MADEKIVENLSEEKIVENLTPEEIEKREIDAVLRDGQAEVPRFSPQQRLVYLRQVHTVRSNNLNALREDMAIASAIKDDRSIERIRELAKLEWKAIKAVNEAIKALETQ